MSPAAEALYAVIGAPECREPPGFRFSGTFAQMTWESLYGDLGAGWFANRFLYLFGPEARQLDELLQLWSFLLPPADERIVIGRNAYGALLLMESPSSRGTVAPVRLLDPLQVRHWGDEHLDFTGCIGHWLPQNKIPHFLDRRVYDQWLEKTGRHLEADEILAIKTPLSLGGTMALDNFQVEHIRDYYRSTAAIYADRGGG